MWTLDAFRLMTKKKGSTVWIPLSGYEEHTQIAEHLQSPTFWCEDYLKIKKKKSLFPGFPFTPLTVGCGGTTSSCWAFFSRIHDMSVSAEPHKAGHPDPDCFSSYKGMGKKKTGDGPLLLNRRQQLISQNFTCFWRHLSSLHFTQLSFDLMSLTGLSRITSV